MTRRDYHAERVRTLPSRRRRAEPQPGPDDGAAAFDEEQVVGALLLAPESIPDVAELVDASDFQEGRLATIVAQLSAMTAEGRQVTFPSLVDALSHSGVLAIVGGPTFLAQLVDDVATVAHLEAQARAVRRRSIEREIARLHRAAARDPTPDVARAARIAALEGELEGATQTAPERLALAGDDLVRLRARPERFSPLPRLLDSMPSLVILNGKPKTAKTRLATYLALCWACGVSPWTGAPRLPGTRALVVSAEQPATRVERTMRQLDTMANHVTRDRWTARVALVARDPDLPGGARALLTLDAPGLATLRRLLRGAQREGDPFGLMVLDSLSRLKPADVEEIDADGMSRWLGALQEIAETFATYILLLHHVGHADRETVSAGRGSSAIAAVAQTVWKLERDARQPRHRILHVEGNDLPAEGEIRFRVVPEEGQPGAVMFFKPEAPGEQIKLDDVLASGERITASQLAARVHVALGREGQPSQASKEVARKMRERWEASGEIVVKAEGAGKPTWIERPETGGGA